MWDGPHGDFLRDIGVSPDDPSNVIQTPEQIRARFDELRVGQREFIDRVNAQLPAKVIPWAMIPWSVWANQHAGFLVVTCKLFPPLPWNMMLLPEDQRGEMIYDLPQHPRGCPPGLEEAAEREIGEISKAFFEVHKRTHEALGRGDTSCLSDYGIAVKSAADCVVALAQVFGSATFGDEAYARHKAVFGGTLGWNTDGG